MATTVRLTQNYTLSGVPYKAGDLVSIDSTLATQLSAAKVTDSAAAAITQATTEGKVIKYPDVDALTYQKSASKKEDIDSYLTVAEIPSSPGTYRVGTQLYVGDGVSLQPISGADVRGAKNWYTNLAAGKTQTMVFSGDSTTDNISQSTYLSETGGAWNQLYSVAQNIPPSTVIYCRGSQGAQLGTFAAGEAMTTSGANSASLATIAAFGADVVHLCWGLNDARLGSLGISATAIEGTQYASAQMQAFAVIMRNWFAIAVAAIRVVNPNAIIVFRRPSSVLQGSGLVGGGFSSPATMTAQNVLDALRLVYCGDSLLSNAALQKPIDQYYTNAVFVDSCRQLYGDLAPATAHPLLLGPLGSGGYGFHPTTYAYKAIIRSALEPFNQAANNTITSQSDSFSKKAIESTSSQTLALANFGTSSGTYYDSAARNVDTNTVNNLTLSGQFDEVAQGIVVASVPGSYLRVAFGVGNIDNLETGALTSAQVLSAAFGGVAGRTYGQDAPPALALGDIWLITPPTGSQQFCVMNYPPQANNNAYLRWDSQSPDGTWSASQYPIWPANSSIRIFRHKYSFSRAAWMALSLLNNPGMGKTLATVLGFKKYYRIMVTAPTSATVVTIQAIGGVEAGAGDLTTHVMTQTDQLCILGYDSADQGGLALTGATFSTTTSQIGTTGICTITMAGAKNFNTPGFLQGFLLSNT